MAILVDGKENWPYRLIKKPERNRSIVLWWKFPIIYRFIEWMRLPTVYWDDDDDTTLRHEEGHVIWYWHDGALPFMFKWKFNEKYRRDAEGFSIARRIYAKMIGGGYEIVGLMDYYSSKMADSYNLDNTTIDECRQTLEFYYDRMAHHGWGVGYARPG